MRDRRLPTPPPELGDLRIVQAFVDTAGGEERAETFAGRINAPAARRRHERYY